jgi:predicted esterase
MRLSFLLLLGCFSLVHLLKAQTQHIFTSGLIVTDCHRYGREAIVTDQIAYQLYTGQLKKPEENANVFTNQQGADVSWKAIAVDSTGKFRGGLLMNGYLYLTYQSTHARNAILNISGNGMFYFNGEPRAGDIYGDGWMKTPVQLKAGLNEILVRCGSFSRWQGVSAKLMFDQKPVFISTDDATLPHIVLGEGQENLFGAVVIINQTNRAVNDLAIAATLNGKTVETRIPSITPSTMRKSPFTFDASLITSKGDNSCTIQLKQKGRIIDQQTLTIQAVDATEHHSYTFISAIDGSVQYYSVAPRSKGNSDKSALFLSVHGAGVQAIGQARAYQSKDWGVLVAPTNRRPRGFNWEDWGRLDALEVLDLATKRYQPDPEKIYLTGHSMGGHGTWYLGATYPDKWAAIAPCAGYPTLTGYGSADGKIPENGKSLIEETLLRASNASNVIALARNYKDLGVYIHHGDSDKVVSVDYARQMRKVLGDFHSDFSYYEYPGGSHWFGNESVDWAPIFDFFKWHRVKQDSAADVLDFITANPVISSKHHWASILQQQKHLDYSKIHLVRDRKAKVIKGSTENVATLRLALDEFAAGDALQLVIDSVKISHTITATREVCLSGFPNWKVSAQPDVKHKNEQRSGTFKEAFNHTMVLVYGTGGNKQENAWAFNKARYDAEVWYYRGNGMVEVIPDKDFAPEKFKDRGVILYGNSVTNTAWNKLLKGCPINITRDRITAGKNSYQGKDLATYFTWPRPDSNIAMVAVIGGTGLPGMSAADPNQYFAAGSGFPDYMIFTAEMLNTGAKGIRAAGFYNNKWELTD